ncbi:MAG: hypothetical protein Q8Q18_01565 [bacterium]|nr:hypothetical protein [bacterium]
MAIKTNKSYTKRLKVTKNGKLVARRPGQGHFNARDNSSASMAKRGSKNITINQKELSHLIPGTKAKK